MLPPSLLPHHLDTDLRSDALVVHRDVASNAGIISAVTLDSKCRHGRLDRSVPTEHLTEILSKNVAEMTRADGFIGIPHAVPAL